MTGKRWSCSVSPGLSDRLGVAVDDHVRIDRDGDPPCHARVRAIHSKEKYPFRVPERTRESAGLDHHERVALSGVVPREEYVEARRVGGLAETVWDDGRRDEVLVYAPHGGDVEFGTDDAAIRLYHALEERGYGASLWCLHGFGADSFGRWHASKPGLTAGSYPGLERVRTRNYDLVVSFHVQDESYTAVGGGAEESLRAAVAAEMDDRIRDRYEFRHDHGEMRWAGRSDGNLVNRLCAGPGGLQVEMQPIVGYKYRKRAVRAVASAVEDSLGADD